MGAISSYPAASGVTDDDVFLGNDGAVTKKFTAAILKAYVQSGGAVTANTRTSSYTATLADAGQITLMNVATANNFTVPTHASVPYSLYTILEVIQIGAGATTLVASSGVTINKPASQSLVLAERYASVTLLKIANDTWLASGMLT